MKFRILGRTGYRVSEIGFGGWAIGGSWGQQNDRDSIAALNAAIDKGVNIIDTAAGYGEGKSERIIAQVLRNRPETIIVATKIPPKPGPWPPSPYCDMETRYPESYLYENIKQRLNNLKTDTIDILQLHTWTRAWNKNPRPLDTLKKMQKEGLIKYIGISTPEHDQNSVIQLMRRGYLDVVQVIYNIFEQEPVAELLPVALENNVGIIGRVVFDEGVLTGKYSVDSLFPADDFRSKYFEGDRLARAVNRVERIKKELENKGHTMPQAAIKFALSHPAISTVIPGIRNERQALMNTSVSDLAPLEENIIKRLQKHAWKRGFWYDGK